MSKCMRLSFTVSERVSDMVSDFLLGLEASGVAEDEVVDGELMIKAYYPVGADITYIVTALGNYMAFLEDGSNDIEFGDLKIEEIDNSTWEFWKNELKTVKAGRVIVIRPPWEEHNPGKGEIVIEINPSRAFGTGHHETTKLCIGYIEDFVEQNGVGSMLDVGCGSGILSITAAKLGINTVVGFDIDPVAVDEAGENIERNTTHEGLYVFTGTIEEVEGAFDLIVANVNVVAILLMKDEIKKRLASGGKFVASGIPVTRRDEAVSGLAKTGLRLSEERRDGDWVGLVFEL